MNEALVNKLKQAEVRIDSKTGKLIFTEKASIKMRYKTTEAGIKEPMTGDLPKVIYPVFRAITGNKVTRNSTYYPKEELIGDYYAGTGVRSWTYPYEIPVILDHDESSSEKILGRIVASRYEESAGRGTEGYLALAAQIHDEKAIRKILDGRYHTMSVGVSANEVECSICGQKMNQDGWCEHVKGEIYHVKTVSGTQDQMCHYKIRGINAREISFVPVPSDDQSGVVTPDLGTKGLKVWAAKPGTSSTVSEMATGRKLSLAEALKGFSITENLKNPGKGKEMVDDILKAAQSLNENSPKEEVEIIHTAIEKVGLSANHRFRIKLNETEGIPALYDETVEKQETVTINEFVQKIEEEIKSLKENYTSKVKECEELSEKNKTLETQLNEFALKTESVLQNEVESLQKSLSQEKENSHTFLATVVAIEMKRKDYSFAKQRTFDELVECLSKRTDESLQDSYSDILAIEVESPVSVLTTERVHNPAHENISSSDTESSYKTTLAKIQELFVKQNMSLTDDVIPGVKVVTPIEDEPETVIVKTQPDGSITFELNKADKETITELEKYTL